MLSRRLFETSEDVTQEAVCQLNFDSPVKEIDILSVVTPKIKRNMFPEPDEDSGLGMEYDFRASPLSVKRKHNEDADVNTPPFKRQKSAIDIKTAVNILADTDDLIADGSRQYTLPTVPGKHIDVKSITPETLAGLINGKYSDVIDSYRIIDCRYPYEYEGGHIRGAENRYLHQTILNLLQEPTSTTEVIIFHCEFSSERGPKMLRFLRRKDRELNKENYPALNFPEIYLLDKGYKAFFCEQSQLCDPVSYRPMLHSDHSADLRHFRAKSKSWTAGEKRQYAKKAMRF